MTRVETGKGVQEYDPAWDDDLDGDKMPERLQDLLEEPATMETVEPLSVLDVASAILKLKGPLDTYQLQKLCYYAQAQHVAFYNTRLFREPIEAWPNGPVIRELYRRHAGKRRIEALSDGDPLKVEAQPAAADTVTAVLKEYGDFTGPQLVEMTHREQPWRDARRTLRPKQPSRAEIPVEALRDYYQGFDDIEPVDEDSVKSP